jgi:hypothetical protein|tara:strand:- start:260 stop:1168 length:909 start_codon:yes stop_codon:yes gene_type:complete
MKSFTYRTVILAITLMIVSCSESPVNTNQVDEVTANNLMDQFTESFSAAWASGDAEAIGQLYSEDAIRIVSTSATPIYGREAIISDYGVNFSSPDGATIVKAIAEVAKFISDDIVIGAGTYEVIEADGTIGASGLWGNAFQLKAGRLLMLMESTGDMATAGMNPSSLAIPQVIDAVYVGPRADALNRIVTTYEENSVTNPKAVADLFLNDGLHVISGNGRVISGKEDILESLTSNAVPGVTLDAWSYGYREIGNSVAIGWGGYNLTDTDGTIIEYGQWGNINKITADRDMVLMERAGPFSGQ